MYFTRIEGASGLIALEEAASLMSANQPAARAWLTALSKTQGALICLGEEGSATRALAAGVIERGAHWPVFFLQELCVAPMRRRCGIGEELLAFALAAAVDLGAREVIAIERLAAQGDAFLRKQGFAAAGDGKRLAKGLPRAP